MIPLTPRLYRAAECLLVHSEYIGVIHAPTLRPLRLVGRGHKRHTVALCLWATHNVVVEPRLRDVLLPYGVAQRLQVVAARQAQHARRSDRPERLTRTENAR